ncbi:MAG TPA: hypothetical protein VM328_13085, partial [Fimbriimonadaceae bacterium]|nr:hypothetical protein [Fimbriimonadaceae bacterium]
MFAVLLIPLLGFTCDNGEQQALATEESCCGDSYDPVDAARGLATSQGGKPQIVASSYIGSTYSLEVVLRQCAVVAAGEIVGIERQAHTPYNSNGPQQHTVFKFKVTHVVKGDIR